MIFSLVFLTTPVTLPAHPQQVKHPNSHQAMSGLTRFPDTQAPWYNLRVLPYEK